MIKVKINKVVPYDESMKIKGEPMVIGDKKYVSSQTRIQQNYTGYPVYLHLITTLPQQNYDYEYLKIDIKAQNIQFGKLLNKQQQIFKDLKKNSSRREFVFDFVPQLKGSYLINMDTAYRVKYFVQGSQPPQEKRQNNHITLKCEDPFQLKENMVLQDRAGSITFPLFLQYSLESKLPFQVFDAQSSFQSEKFVAKSLHNEERVKLKKNQIYYLMYEIEPKSVKEILSEKGITIGQVQLKYGVNGNYSYKTTLKPKDKYVFFRGITLTKQVTKKDIVEIEVKFSKIYNLNFALGPLKLVIDEEAMPSIKIIKTSRDKINLDTNIEEVIKLSIICLKSGHFQLKGITLNTEQSLFVYFINDLNIYVGNEMEHKSSNVLEHTAQFMIQDSLL